MKVANYSQAEAPALTQVIGLDKSADHDCNAVFDGGNHDMNGYVHVELKGGISLYVEFTGNCTSDYTPAEYENYGGRTYEVWGDSVDGQNWEIENWKVVEAYDIEANDECPVPLLTWVDKKCLTDCINDVIAEV